MTFKYLIVLTFFATSLSQAADLKLVCNFKDKHNRLLYGVEAAYKPNKSLQIEKIVNSASSISKNTVTDEDVNNNPVPQFKSSTGTLRYDIDAMSTDPEYGDKYVLYFSKLEPSRSSFSVSIRYTNYSGSQGPSDFAEGLCTLK